MEYMHVIVFLFKTNLSLFISGYFIFFLILFMFALLGFNFYENKFEKDIFVYQTYNFDSFSNSFITVFNIITLENWYHIFIEASSYQNSFFQFYY